MLVGGSTTVLLLQFRIIRSSTMQEISEGKNHRNRALAYVIFFFES